MLTKEVSKNEIRFGIFLILILFALGVFSSFPEFIFYKTGHQTKIRNLVHTSLYSFSIVLFWAILFRVIVYVFEITRLKILFAIFIVFACIASLGNILSLIIVNEYFQYSFVIITGITAILQIFILIKFIGINKNEIDIIGYLHYYSIFYFAWVLGCLTVSSINSFSIINNSYSVSNKIYIITSTLGLIPYIFAFLFFRSLLKKKY